MTTPDTVDGTEWTDLSEEQREIFLAAMKRSGLDTETLTKSKSAPMLTEQDKERLAKASQGAGLLVADLRDLVKASNPLLADIALELLVQAVQLEHRLSRLEACTKPEA